MKGFLWLLFSVVIMASCNYSVREYIYDKVKEPESLPESLPVSAVPLKPIEEKSDIPEFPSLDSSGSNYFPFKYTNFNGKYYLCVNIFGRGHNGVETPDIFVLQTASGNGWEFPVGKWMSVKDNEEYVEFTDDQITRFSTYKPLGTLVLSYTIEDEAFHTELISHTPGE
jgi:hypothetical protein